MIKINDVMVKNSSEYTVIETNIKFDTMSEKYETFITMVDKESNEIEVAKPVVDKFYFKKHEQVVAYAFTDGTYTVSMVDDNLNTSDLASFENWKDTEQYLIDNNLDYELAD